jgi:CRP-like cAMP-binding protein
MLVDGPKVALVERVLLLRACPLLKNLGLFELARMAEHMRSRRFASEAILLRPGVPLSVLVFMREGHADVMSSAAEPRRVGPRDTLGDLADLFHDAAAPTVVARSPVLTLELERSDLEDLLEDEFSIYHGVLRALAQRLVQQRVLRGEAAPKTGEPMPRYEHHDLDLVERILMLRRTAAFAGADVEALAELAELATPLVLPPRSVLWSAGAASDHFLVPVSGRILASTARRSTAFGPGSTLGLFESLSGAARWFDAVAATEARALRVPTSALVDLAEDNFALGMTLLRATARAARGSDTSAP